MLVDQKRGWLGIAGLVFGWWRYNVCMFPKFVPTFGDTITFDFFSFGFLFQWWTTSLIAFAPNITRNIRNEIRVSFCLARVCWSSVHRLYSVAMFHVSTCRTILANIFLVIRISLHFFVWRRTFDFTRLQPRNSK